MKMYGHHRANHYDNPNAWEAEGAYIPAVGLSGMGDALPTGTGTPTVSTVPWWQSLITAGAQTYSAVKQATAKPAIAAPVAVKAATGPSTNQMLMIGAVGLGVVALLAFGLKKKR